MNPAARVRKFREGAPGEELFFDCMNAYFDYVDECESAYVGYVDCDGRWLFCHFGGRDLAHAEEMVRADKAASPDANLHWHRLSSKN